MPQEHTHLKASAPPDLHHPLVIGRHQPQHQQSHSLHVQHPPTHVRVQGHEHVAVGGSLLGCQYRYKLSQVLLPLRCPPLGGAVPPERGDERADQRCGTMFGAGRFVCALFLHPSIGQNTRHASYFISAKIVTLRKKAPDTYSGRSTTYRLAGGGGYVISAPSNIQHEEGMLEYKRCTP